MHHWDTHVCVITTVKVRPTENIFAFLLQFRLDHLLCPDAACLCGEVEKHWHVVALVCDAHQQTAGYHRLSTHTNTRCHDKHPSTIFKAIAYLDR